MHDSKQEPRKAGAPKTTPAPFKHNDQKTKGAPRKPDNQASAGPGATSGPKPAGASERRGSQQWTPTPASSQAAEQNASKPKAFDSRVSPARRAALEVGMIVRQRNAFAQETIAKHIDTESLSSEDRAFATLLALGVASSYGTLDEVINRCLRKPEDIQDNVRDALRVSTYEIIFLDKSPHAAVDQGVELVKSIAPKAAGLANAVLRKIVEAKKSFPFGDPAQDSAALARMSAFPLWLTNRLIADLGREGALNFMVASNEPAPLFIAVNSLKAQSEDVHTVLSDAGANPSAVVIDQERLPGCFHVSDARVLQDAGVKQLLKQGKILVSDAASQKVAYSILGDKAPQSFLEIGSGRATKTILLQSNSNRLFGKQMDLFALDNHEFKMKILKERASLYGVELAGTYVGDATQLDTVVGKKMFDMVFIDAPCSGLGTLRRHPEIRWRIKREDIDALAELGLSMLKQATAHVSVGGVLAYATCTVTHTENTMVIKRFLESEEGLCFKLAPICEKSSFSTKLMPRSYDAHFAVRMIRIK